MKDLLVGLGLLCCPALVFVLFGTSGMEAFEEGTAERPPAESALLGRIAFASECARCHGRLAGGTSRGPDLIRPAYGPAVVSDNQIQRAVREGVAAQDGSAGMPAVDNVSDRRLDDVITFLREMQRSNGIR
jgi:mono/diheme cytochrome c family protein